MKISKLITTGLMVTTITTSAFSGGCLDALNKAEKFTSTTHKIIHSQVGWAGISINDFSPMSQLKRIESTQRFLNDKTRNNRYKVNDACKDKNTFDKYFGKRESEWLETLASDRLKQWEVDNKVKTDALANDIAAFTAQK